MRCPKGSHAFKKNLMSDHLIVDIAQKHNLRRRTGRWVGACPECGGSAKNDKFVLRDDGGFKCHGCLFKGDLITWFRKREGMTCPEAHQHVGKPCENTACAVRENCRMGDGKGVSGSRRRALQPRDTRKAPQELAEADGASPMGVWFTWAEALVEKAHGHLLDNPEQLAWLAGRGIDREAVVRFRLGWLSHSLKVARAEIGLPPHEDGKPHLWVPDGLVIPIADDLTLAHRLRIRRPRASRGKFLPELKYMWLEGSGKSPLVIEPLSGQVRGAVIVEAELDAFACASAHPDVLVVALGTVRGGITAELRARLAAAPVILVALDADQEKETAAGKKHAAGPEAIASWAFTYRHASYWPPLQGKDAGEYAQAGGDLRAWIESGLPAPALAHAQNLPSACSIPEGVRGKEAIPMNEPEEEHEEELEITDHMVRTVTLKNGRTFHVVKDQATWLQLVEEGEIVFSENELLRLQQATSTMENDERLAAAMQVLDVKELFGGAYIRRGAVVSETVPESYVWE